MEKNKKTLLIGGSIMTGVIVAAIGVATVVLSGNEEEVSKNKFQNDTPGAVEAAQQPGQIAFQAQQIPLQQMPDGSIQGTGTISALFQPFRPTALRIEGDPRIQWSSECFGPNKVIETGQSCQITFTLNANSLETPEAGAVPQVIASGNTTTPGGATIPVEAVAQLMAGDPNAPQGLPVNGASAPAGLDPYGQPLPPTQALQGAPATDNTAPPIDYSQAPPPPEKPTLSPREQFLLARRQAVFNNIVGHGQRGSTPNRPTGNWGSLTVPSTTSSLPQDMSRVVTMDRIITAALVRPIDNRGAGQVTAQVDRNVYSAHGRNVLIPRGSMLIGTASGSGERVAISWTQIIRPDGARFVFQGTSGDAMGQGGIPGRRNERLLRRYGSILLGTVLTSGTAAAFGAEEQASGGLGGEGGRNTGAIISDIVRQDIQRITQDIIQRNQNIQPIVTVPAGTRITVVPTMDLVMAPQSRRQIEVPSYPRRQNGGAAAPADVPQPSRNGQEPAVDFAAPVENSGPTPAWNEN